MAPSSQVLEPPQNPGPFRLDKNRRLWRNGERLLNTSLQFVHLAFLALLLRRS